MSDFLLALFLISMLGMLLGLIKPGWVLRWGKRRTRPRALGWYALFSIIFFIAFGFTIPQRNKPSTVTEQAAQVAGTEEMKPVAKAKPPENKPGVSADTDAIKNTVRDFQTNILITVQAFNGSMEKFQNKARKMGKGATAGDLYAALKDAQQMARAGRELTMRLEIPKDLPQEIRGYLWQIQVAFRESFDKRYMGIGAWMDYLDNRKPSVEAKATEYMDEAKSWEEKGWEICKLARRAAGFTEGKEKLE